MAPLAPLESNVQAEPKPTQSPTRHDVCKSLTNPDWRWRSFDHTENDTRYPPRRKHISATNKGPFEVMYLKRKPQIPWPDVVHIALFSRSLIQILQNHLPDNWNLKSLAIPVIAGRELYFVLDSLKQHEFRVGGDFRVQPATVDVVGAPTSGEGVGKNEDSPTIRSSSAEERAPERTEAEDWASQPTTASQIADAAAMPALADQAVDGAPASNDEVGKYEDSPRIQSLSNEERAPVHAEEHFSSLPKVLRYPEQRIEDGVPEDEASRSNENTTSSDPKAFPVLTEVEIGLCHLKHLVRCLQEEYEDVQKTIRRSREKKEVAWDMLWAFLPRGAEVVHYCGTSKEICFARVSECYYRSDTEFFTVKLDVWDYNGKCYRKCRTGRDILKYRGEKSFSDLVVCPAAMVEISQQSREQYLTRGKLFHELVLTSTHMHYTGIMFHKNTSGPRTTVSKEKADGRVMIDLASFAEMNPYYPMENARPPTPSVLSFENQCCEDESHVVSDESLLASPAIVYGFSFALHRWGALILTGLTEITFKKSAFEGLTMAQDKKTMVYNLVSQYASKSNDVSASESPEQGQQVNLLTRKGDGCAFLCYGDSGSGKSLTAESIAESLERPLWDVSVSSLISGPIFKVERDFMAIIDLAVRWQAILLFNDADVFLTRRDGAVGVSFQRILEYNHGVMFLVTTDIDLVEDAFRTRISVFLHLKDFSAEDRQKLWRTLLTTAAVKGVTDALCTELATPDLSGREIRNALRTARLWAKSVAEPIAAKHLKHVIEMRVSSLESIDPKPSIYT